MAREDRTEGYRILLWIAAFAIAAVVILRATSDQEDSPSDDYAHTPGDSETSPSRTVSDSAAREHETPSSADLDSSVKKLKDAKIRSGIGTITGRVSDRDNSPVPGIEVRLIFLDWEAHEPRPAGTLELTSVSDEKGAFKFSDLPLGRYFAEAFTDGLGSSSQRTITQSNPSGKINLRLRESWILSGRVVDSDGRPISNAELLPSMLRMSGRTHGVNQGESYYNNFRTDDEGLFAIARLGADTEFLLLVKAKGYATYASEFIGRDSGTVEFVLDQGVRYYGHVVQLDSGEPVSDIGLRLTTAMRSDRMDVRTDAQGAFEFPMVRPGLYNADIQREDWVVANHPLRLTIDAETVAEPQTIEVARGGVVSGRVYIESTGRGVGDIYVRATTSEFQLGRIVNTRTDSEGNYRITGLPQAVYALRRKETKEYPDRIGREENAHVIRVAATLNQESTGNDFALKAGLHITGRVVDVNDEVIDGASVHVRNQTTSSSSSSSTSDSNGAFSLAGLAPHSRYELRASKDGYAKIRALEMQISDEDLRGQVIVMQPEASVSGVVVDPRGNGVAKAEILFRPEQSNHYGGDAESDDAGAFRVSQMAGGVYRVELRSSRFSDNSYDPGLEIDLEAGEQLEDLRIVYDKEAGLSIEGRVTDTRRQPIEDANVDAFAISGGDVDAQTDASGNYRISGLKEGIYYVSASYSGFSRQHLKDVEAGSKGIDFQLVGTGTLKGFVVDAATGEPVTSFRITQRKAPSPLDRFRDHSHDTQGDLEGRFELLKVKEGSAIISVRADGYAPAYKEVVGVTENSELTGIRIALQTGAAVSGRVLNSLGNPVSSARVQLVRDTIGINRKTTYTDTEGAFLLDGLGPGKIGLMVEHDDYAPASQTLTLSASGSSEVTFTIHAGATLEGQVTVGGEPFPGTELRIRYPETEEDDLTGPASRATTTDGTGHYQVAHLAAGISSVSVNSRQNGRGERRRLHKEFTVSIPRGGTVQMDLDLPATSAALTGTVYDEGNAPIQARVRAELRDGAGLTSVSKKTDANGEYLLEGLVGGTAAITAYAEGHPNRKVTATLVENTVTPLDIYLYGGGTLNVFLANLSPDLSIRAVSVFRGALNISVSSSNWRDEYKNFQVFNQSVKGDSISVPGLEPGQYTVVATATLDRPRTTEEDYLTYLQVASAVVTVQSEGEQVEVTLAPTGGR